MAAGDGVSLPTTLAQMGSVAKAQARGQQSATQTTPFTGQLAGEEELQIHRVGETEETAQEQIDPERHPPDKRKRRRLKRNQKQLAGDEAERALDELNDHGGDEVAPEEQLGVLIDMRV